MITIKIQGGLGNQMFQYALGRAMSLKHGTAFKMDLVFLMHRISRKNLTFRNYQLSKFNVTENFTTSSKIARYSPNLIFGLIFIINFIKKKFKLSYIAESAQNIDLSNKSLLNNAYFDGYWQDEKYFKEFRDIIVKDFSLKEEATGLNLKYLEKISSCNSVSVHIRRGDYVKLNLSELCSIDYYHKSIEHIRGNVENPIFFIFSDDTRWVRDNLKIDGKYFIIDNNSNDPSEDLRLMSSCQHNIIANSSFSWWGAWLNKNINKIVVAPATWSNNPNIINISPSEWFKI